MYLDYLDSFIGTGSQILELSENIIDLSTRSSGVDIFTTLLPTGDTVQGPNNSSYLVTIDSVNNGSSLLEDLERIKKYGRIVRTKSFSGADTPAKLKSVAEQYFRDLKEDPDYEFEVSAVDLNMFNESVENFKIGQRVKVYSKPHNLDIFLIIKAISYSLGRPDETSITLGVLEHDEENVTKKQDKKGIASSVGRSGGGYSGGGSAGQIFKYIKEMEDAVSIAAKNISLLGENINLKVDKDKLISEINLSKEGISISGRKIVVSGTDGIQIISGGSVKDLQAVVDDVYSLIEANESSISLRVEKSKIINEINVSTEGIKISGTKILLSGSDGIIAKGNLTVQGELNALRASIESLFAGQAYAHGITVGTLRAGILVLAGQKVYSSYYRQTRSLSLEVERTGPDPQYITAVSLNHVFDYRAVLMR